VNPKEGKHSPNVGEVKRIVEVRVRLRQGGGKGGGQTATRFQEKTVAEVEKRLFWCIIPGKKGGVPNHTAILNRGVKGLGAVKKNR